MSYYKDAKLINTTPRIHLILTSLCLEMWDNEKSPNMYSVSVNDPQAAKDITYTPTEYFPSLDIHSPSRSCTSPVCDGTIEARPDRLMDPSKAWVRSANQTCVPDHYVDRSQYKTPSSPYYAYHGIIWLYIVFWTSYIKYGTIRYFPYQATL